MYPVIPLTRMLVYLPIPSQSEITGPNLIRTPRRPLMHRIIDTDGVLQEGQLLSPERCLTSSPTTALASPKTISVLSA